MSSKILQIIQNIIFSCIMIIIAVNLLISYLLATITINSGHGYPNFPMDKQFISLLVMILLIIIYILIDYFYNIK